MLTKVFTIPSTGERLRLEWEGNYKSFTVYLNDVQIGTPYAKLTDGAHLTTADGHEIDIQLLKSKMGFSSRALQVSWDRQVLAGSETDDHLAVKDATGCSGLVVILMVLFSLLTLSSPTTNIPLVLIEVAIYVVLWFFIRQGSFPALLAFIILYAISTVYMLVTILPLAQYVTAAGWIGLLLRGLALYILIKGAIALNKLKKTGA